MKNEDVTPLLLSYSEVSGGSFQGGYHFFRRNSARVIDHGIDLPEPAKILPHLFHAFQPLQG